MFSCYIFANNFDDENCLSLRLDSNGSIDAPLRVRTIDEFKSLQEHSKTIIVLPTRLCSIHELELPLLNSGKARPAITYALEDELAQPVTLIHFVFDRAYYVNNKYLIIVIDRNIIIDLKNKLSRLKINYDVITNDWFALDNGSACVAENSFIVNDATFKGAINIDLLDNYLKTQASFSHILKFNDSKSLTYSEQFTTVDLDFHTWVATKLFKQKPMNFCQGEFQHNTHHKNSKYWYKLAVVLGTTWFFALIFTNMINLFVLNSKLADYDKRIAVVYKFFFPEAKQVISPKFRINQLVKQNQSGYDALFWKLLSKLSSVMSKNNSQLVNVYSDDVVSIQQIRFQNLSLSVILICRDFTVLAEIEDNLKKNSVTVRKSGAATKGDKIVATLELS